MELPYPYSDSHHKHLKVKSKSVETLKSLFTVDLKKIRDISKLNSLQLI